MHLLLYYMQQGALLFAFNIIVVEMLKNSSQKESPGSGAPWAGYKMMVLFSYWGKL